MEKAKFLLFVFTIFLIAITSLVSADLDIINGTISLNASHNSAVSSSFVLNNTNATYNVTNITFSATNLVNGSNIINSGNITFSPSSITNLQNLTNQNITFSVNVPQYQVPGIYTATINASGNRSDTNASVSDTFTLTLNVNTSRTWTVLAPTNISTVPGKSETTTFKITNTGNVNLTDINITYNASALEDDDGDKIILSFSPSYIETLIPSNSSTITINASASADINIAEYSTTIYVSSSQLNKNLTLTIDVKPSYCKHGNIGKLKIEIKEPDSGDKFYPLEKIGIEVKVTNDDDKDQDVTVAARLFSNDDKKFVGDEEEKEVDLEKKGKDDKETVYLNLKVPADAKAGEYTLYVKAYDDEDEHCYMKSVKINIKRHKHDIVIDSIELPDSVECDSYFDMTIKIVNTGDKDEEDAKIRIYNTQLGIDESKTFDLDKGDYKKVKLSLRVPKDAEEKNYTLTINVLYDEDDGIYGESKTKLATLKIEGNCFVPSYSAVLTAQPVSQPYQEEQFVLKIKIKNTGNIKTNYTVNVSGYDDWATLDKIEPEKIEIEKDKEGFVYVYLTPLEGVIGIKKLVVKISYAGKTSEEEVSINIQQSEITRWTGKVVKAFKENKPLVTINAILVIAIIVLAVLLIGKKTRRTWGRREGSARERERRWHEDIE